MERAASSVVKYVIDRDIHGNDICMDADNAADPHDVIGQSVTLPNELWTGWERCSAKCKKGAKRGLCQKCKRATARTTCSILAFSESEGLYVIEAQEQHYAFRYDQISPHFTVKVQKRTSQKAQNQQQQATASRRRSS